MGRTGRYWIEPSGAIRKIYVYFIDKATNAYNNLKYNNIFFNLCAFTYFEFI